jgi:hypothetical protein
MSKDCIVVDNETYCKHDQVQVDKSVSSSTTKYDVKIQDPCDAFDWYKSQKDKNEPHLHLETIMPNKCFAKLKIGDNLSNTYTNCKTYFEDKLKFDGKVKETTAEDESGYCTFEGDLVAKSALDAIASASSLTVYNSSASLSSSNSSSIQSTTTTTQETNIQETAVTPPTADVPPPTKQVTSVADEYTNMPWISGGGMECNVEYALKKNEPACILRNQSFAHESDAIKACLENKHCHSIRRQINGPNISYHLRRKNDIWKPDPFASSKSIK